MTKIFDDAVTPLEEAELNKMLAADGVVGPYACWGLTIRYTGAAWEAFANAGATDQIANVVLTWNAGNNRLEIDTSSCDNPFATSLPVPIVTPEFTNIAHPIIRVHQNNTNETHVYFYNISDSIRTSESNQMYFNIIWFGKI